jgi:hypothetical protein
MGEGTCAPPVKTYTNMLTIYMGEFIYIYTYIYVYIHIYIYIHMLHVYG